MTEYMLIAENDRRLTRGLTRVEERMRERSLSNRSKPLENDSGEKPFSKTNRPTENESNATRGLEPTKS